MIPGADWQAVIEGNQQLKGERPLDKKREKDAHIRSMTIRTQGARNV